MVAEVAAATAAPVVVGVVLSGVVEAGERGRGVCVSMCV